MKKSQRIKTKDPDLILSMQCSGNTDKATLIIRTIPILFYAAITILIVRLHVYSRPMSQFYWTYETDEMTLYDFFSYNKMVFIIVMACLALAIIITRFLMQTMMVKKCSIYIPMLIYSAFVLISFIASDYKEFSLLGYNERFEGTIPLLCYMVMLFYIVNSITDEKQIKAIFTAIIIASFILSVIGITQATGHDFFRTVAGQKFISPNYSTANGSTVWKEIADAFAHGEEYFDFSYSNDEVYQTVYSFNYVSFYIALLIPVFGMLYVFLYKNKQNCKGYKRILVLIVFALNVFNLACCKASGGFLGLGITIVLAIIVLRNQLKEIIKPILILIIVTALVFAVTINKWKDELQWTFKNVMSSITTSVYAADAASRKPWIDYFITNKGSIELSLNGHYMQIVLDSDSSGKMGIAFIDENGNQIATSLSEDKKIVFEDNNFHDYVMVSVSNGEDNNVYILLHISNTVFKFVCEDDDIKYVNGYGRTVSLDKVDISSFFAHKLTFGSNRGLIWSRGIALLKDTLFIGHGADTFCITFPQNDYAGKFNTWEEWIDVIVDKPHNMYLNMGTGTGCISMLAMIVMYGMYIIQSLNIYWKRDLGNEFLNYAGIGIFFGVTAFLISGLVNDSTVSVMPLFYTLFGIGVVINMIIKKQNQ